MGVCFKLWCNVYIDLFFFVFVVVGKKLSYYCLVIDLELFLLKFYKDFFIFLIYFIFNILYILVVIFFFVI